MADSFTEAMQVAGLLRARQREDALREEIERGDLALRQAAEQRAAETAAAERERRGWEQYAGPIAAADKSPYGVAVAPQYGVLRNLYETRNQPAEPSLAPGVQGPPTLQSTEGREQARQAALDQASAIAQQMWGQRYMYPADVRAGAVTGAADIRGRYGLQEHQLDDATKAEIARLMAEVKGEQGARGAGAKASQQDQKAWTDFTKRNNAGYASLRTVFGGDEALARQADRVLVNIERTGKDPTPNEVAGIVLGIVRQESAGGTGGQVANRMLEHFSPNTLHSDIAAQAQFFQNRPTSAGAQEFVKRWIPILQGERDAARQRNLENVSSDAIAHPELFQGRADSDPRFQFLRSLHMPEEQIRGIKDKWGTPGTVAAPGAPAKPAATGTLQKFRIPAQGWKDPDTGSPYAPGAMIQLDASAYRPEELKDLEIME